MTQRSNFNYPSGPQSDFQTNLKRVDNLFKLWESWESDQRLWINLEDRLHQDEKKMRRP